MARSKRFTEKAYAIGYFSKQKEEFVCFTERGHVDVFDSRKLAEKHNLEVISKYGLPYETLVVEVSIKFPKFKHEMTHAEIEKALGKKIILVK